MCVCHPSCVGWDDIESLKASLASAGQLFVEQAKKEREPLAMLMMHEQKVGLL
jgi:hypothetical protein